MTGVQTCALPICEVHADSTAFSGGLWEARSSLPEADRTAFDKALYKAMRMNADHGDVGFEDLITLFVEALDADLPAGSTALKTAMTKRRLLVDGKGCDRIIEYGTDPVSASDKRLGFAAPGKQSINIKGIAPGVIQIKVAVPDTATQLHVSFAEGHASSQPNPLGGSSKPFTPTLLVKAGAPITWDPKSQNGHDADVRKGITNDDITVDLPAQRNGDAVYVQIASTGDADGAYNDVAIELKDANGATVKPKSEDSAGDTPGAGKPTTQTQVIDDGCGISPRSGAFGPGAALLGLAAVAAVGRRRRRWVWPTK